MSSLLRRQQKRILKKIGKWEVRPRPFRIHKGSDGYDVLRPTKGWLRVSGARLRAQARLRHIAEIIAVRKAR